MDKKALEKEDDTQEDNCIIVVDDDADTRSLVELLLQGHGYSVVTCESGQEALDKLEEITPAVMLLDVMMQHMNGYEVLTRMKQHPKTQNIPVIMLTAKNEGNDILSGYKQGADYYIPKPFTTEQLLYGIEMFLSSK